MRLIAQNSRIAMLSLCCIFLSSCGLVSEWDPYDAALTAKVPVNSSPVGKGVTVTLEAIDGRSSKTVGSRLDDPSVSAPITANAFKSHMETELAEALRLRGFIVASPGTVPDAVIRAKLTTFRFWRKSRSPETYSLSRIFQSPRYLTCRAALSLKATKGGAEISRTHISDVEQDFHDNVLSDQQIDQVLNSCILELLAVITQDEDLMEFLATGIPPISSPNTTTPYPSSKIVSKPKPRSPANFRTEPRKIEFKHFDGYWRAEGNDWTVEMEIYGDRFEMKASCASGHRRFVGNGTVNSDGTIGSINLRPTNQVTPTFSGNLESMVLYSTGWSCSRDELSFKRV